MPAIIIAQLLRQVIMSIATGAVVTGAQELLNGTFKELVAEIRDKEGVTEQDAKDILGNIVADLALNSATILATLRLGVGVKAAEYLGFTSKSVAKKTLKGAAATVATKLATEGGKKVVTSAMPKILKILAIPGTLIWLASALANIIEPGIYKPEQTNALYKKLGIPFQYPTGSGQRKAGLLENSDFIKLAEALEAAGIKGISNPVALQSQNYTRDGLADVIDYVTGKAVLDGKKATASAIRPLIQPYLIGVGTSTTQATSTTSTTTKATSTNTTKVFTGIVSQGVVGQGLVFTPRPDDMIDSVDELREAAANNLAPFLSSLLGKIVYEVKVVSSVITKDGFKQTGTTQRIQTGTDQYGNPKYKTVTNKFATLVVYAITDKGVRAKLTTIVLGPVNSARLTVGQNDLRTLETQLPSDITTTDINMIKGIETANPITVSTPPQVQTPVTVTPATTEKTVIVDKNVLSFAISAKQEGEKISINGDEFRKKNGEMYRISDNALAVAGVGAYVKDTGSASVSDTGTVVSIAGTNSPKAGANASTLSDWYQAQGQSLPSVSARAIIYEQYGLGQASYYTGTAEQNTKLLNELKAR